MRNLFVKPDTRHSTATLEQLCSSLQIGYKLNPTGSPSDSANSLECVTGPLGPRRLIECLAGATGSGAGLIGLYLCQQAVSQAGDFVVVDPQGRFFPPAAVAWGVDAKRLLVVRPKSNRDAIAAVELSLRSAAVAAVWANLDRVDPKASRRLLLATEAADAFGVLVRPAKYQTDPSWSDIQLRCDPLPTADGQTDKLHTRLVQTRNRHGPVAGEVTITMDWRKGTIQERIDHPVINNDESQQLSTHPLPLATRLASAALPPKAS